MQSIRLFHSSYLKKKKIELHWLKINLFCFKKYEKHPFKKKPNIFELSINKFSFFLNFFFLPSKNLTLQGEEKEA